MSSTPSLFNILSVGQTATHWMTSVLQSIPGVVVGHAGVLFQRVLAPGSMSDSASRAHNIGPDRKVQNAVSQIVKTHSLDQLYSLLATHYPGKAYGIIHLFQTQNWTAHYWANPPRNDIRLFNMTRHPVPRQESIYRHWLKTAQMGNTLFLDSINTIFSGESAQDSFESDRERYKLDKASLEVRTWYACLSYVRYFAEDLAMFPRRGTVIEMERIVSDPVYFRDIAQQCVGDAIAVSEECAANAVGRHPVASHSGNATKKSPLAVFEGWEPWQRESFQREGQEHHIGSVYAPFYPDVGTVFAPHDGRRSWHLVPLPRSMAASSWLTRARDIVLERRSVWPFNLCYRYGKPVYQWLKRLN